MPWVSSRLLYMDHVVGRGAALFDAVCRADGEGYLGKWARGRYESDGVSTSWVKVKNPAYSQMQVYDSRFSTATIRRS